jgi:hypothetical protein
VPDDGLMRVMTVTPGVKLGFRAVRVGVAVGSGVMRWRTGLEGGHGEEVESEEGATESEARRCGRRRHEEHEGQGLEPIGS